MELSPNQSFASQFKSMFTGKDYFKTQDGLVVSAKKGTSKVEVTDENVVKVYGGEKVSVYGTKGDDKVLISNAYVSYVFPEGGNNQTILDNCKYKKHNRFWGTGSRIVTGGNWNYKKGSDIIRIKGDFNGGIYAQQGAGKAYGNDKKAHKDVILIDGNNTGFINIDTHDKVKISGKQKGKIVNQSVIYM